MTASPSASRKSPSPGSARPDRIPPPAVSTARPRACPSSSLHCAGIPFDPVAVAGPNPHNPGKVATGARAPTRGIHGFAIVVDGLSSSWSWPHRRCRPTPRLRSAGKRRWWIKCSAPRAWPSPTSTGTARWTSSSATSGTRRPTGRCTRSASPATTATAPTATASASPAGPTTSTATAGRT